jgi:hypothetical protein
LQLNRESRVANIPTPFLLSGLEALLRWGRGCEGLGKNAGGADHGVEALAIKDCVRAMSGCSVGSGEHDECAKKG